MLLVQVNAGSEEGATKLKAAAGAKWTFLKLKDMSFFTRVLAMKCKQTLESEGTYFYHALFASRFHQLPKLSSSQSLEVQNNSPAAAENKGEATVGGSGRAGELLEPAPRRLGRVKSLHEMPGPNTLYNLYEFFWKDGFGRIHEIQVQLTRLLNVLVTPGLLKLFLFSPHKTLFRHRVSSTTAIHRRVPAVSQEPRSRGSPQIQSPYPVALVGFSVFVSVRSL